MKKHFFIFSCFLAVTFFIASIALAQQDPGQIKAEIERHRQAIRQLQGELRSMQGQESGYEEGTGSVDEASGSDAGAESYGQQGLPDRAAVNRPWESEADANKDGVVDKTEINQWNNRGGNRDQFNPPGPAGGPGAGPNALGNPPGPAGGPGKGPRPEGMPPKKDFDNNPPGLRGGPGTNWENKPGPAGGPGARPNALGNPPGPKGGPGKGPDFRQGNPPGPKGGPGAGSKSNPPGPKGGPGKGPKPR